MPEPVSFEETFTIDSANVRLTSNGYLVAEPRIARTGIQTYRGSECGRPQMDEVRIYRPEESVFAKDSLASFAFKPITLGHPNEMVDSANWKNHSVGVAGGDIVRDGEFIRVPMVIMDKSAIQRIQKDHQEISVGYLCELDWTAGKTAGGEVYDAVQKDIRTNHIALVTQARGGHKLRMGDKHGEGDPPMPEPVKKTVVCDGIDVQIDERDAAIVSRTIQKMGDEVKKLNGDVATLTASITDTVKKSEAKDGEIAALKKQLEDSKVTPQMLDKLGIERADFTMKAKKLIGDKFDAAGKTNLEIQKAVVAHKLGDAATVAMSDDAVGGAFRAFTADIKDDNQNSVRGLADALGGRSQENRDAASTAYDKQGERLRDAWKKGNKAA